MADAEDTKKTDNISTNTEQSLDTIERTPDTDKEKTGYAEIDSLVDAKTDIIDNNLFSLPTDRDFYINAVDTDWYVNIANAVKAGSGTTPIDKTKAAVYYTEDPPIMEPGYYSDKQVYVIQPTNLKRESQDVDVFMGYQDGDTISFSASECNCGDSETQNFIESSAQEMTIKMLGYDPTSSSLADEIWNKVKLDTLEVRVFGVDCPEVPHVSVLSAQSGARISSCKLGDLQADGDSVFIKYGCTNNTNDNAISWTYDSRDPNTDTHYITVGGSKREVLSKDEYAKLRGDYSRLDYTEATDYVFASVDNTNKALLAQGYAAGRIMHKLVNQATDCRIMINAANMSIKGNSSYPTHFLNGSINNQDAYSPTGNVWNDLKQLAAPFIGHSLFQSSGFNQAGQELYGRLLGAVYLYGPFGDSDTSIWINAAKYIASETPQTQVNKSINGSVVNGALNNLAPDIFGSESYEYNWALYADALWDRLEKFDDRYDVQKEVLKEHLGRLKAMADISNFDELKEWTCLIGDVAFMVPPTSIRCITQTTTERVPLVRAKGTIAKGGEHSDRLIEIHLFFNEEEGINGVSWTTDLPTAKSTQVENPEDAKITYYMNGLRALVSEFRLVPYVPIDNKYINEVLNVTAVCFQNISISTVPNFPKLIQCVLTLREFSPASFLPQIPDKFEEIDFRNYFAKMINYETMRYYYQRPLILGNQLAEEAVQNNSRVDITSKDFMTKTLFSNRTAMLPCRFDTPEMDFYVTSESYLNKLLNVKRNMAQKASGGTFQPRTEAQQKYMDAISKVVQGIYEAKNDSSLQDYLSNLPDSPSAEQFDTIFSTIAKYVRQYGNEAVADISTSTLNGASYPYIQIRIDAPSIESDTQLQTLRDMAGADSGSIDLSDAVKDKTLTVALAKDGNGTWYLDTQSKDMLFATYCYNHANTKDANTEAMKYKQSIDIEDPDSIVFEPYLSHVRIDAISVQFANTMTSVALQNSDSVAPQYMGGTDCSLVINLTTTSESVAALLDKLPKYSAYLHRTYHLVLPMYPVKIDSDFTRMLGINEVSFDNVVVNTVPNFPGVYSIQLTLKSVDRTLRNREALKRVNVVDHTNEHITNHKDIQKDRINTYFDLADTISQVNLYPDLELPSVKELAEHGFQFIRYKNRTMKYPDPDFYFIYPGAIFNEIVRETIFSFMDTMKRGLGNTSYSDKFGAQLNMNFLGQIDMKSANEKFKAQMNFMRDQEKKEIEDANRRAEVMDEALEGAMVADPGSWDISPQLKVVFMETYYFRELMLYLNQIKLGIFKHNTKADTLAEKEAYEANKDNTNDDDPDFQQQLANDKKAIEQAAQGKAESQVEKNKKAAAAAWMAMNASSNTDNKTKGDNNGKATTDAATTNKDTSSGTDNTKNVKIMAANAETTTTDNQKVAVKPVTDTNGSSADTNTQTDADKKKADAQTDKISYQATKGLHLYDRLQIVRDKVKEITDTLNNPVEDASNFTVDTLDMYLYGIYGNYISCFADETHDASKEMSTISNLFAAAVAARSGRKEFNYQEFEERNKQATTAAGTVIGATVGGIASGGILATVGSALGGAAGYLASNVIRKKYTFKDALTNTTEMWLPDAHIVGVATNSVGQDPSGRQYITKEQYDAAKETGGDTFNNLLDSLTEVGVCRIKFYSKSGIINKISPDILDDDKLKTKDAEGYNGSNPVFCIDPYYRYKTVSEIRDFKQKLIESTTFSAQIFVREFLYWLSRLYATYTMPSISFDIHRKEARNEQQILAELQEQIDQYNGNKQATSTSSATSNLQNVSENPTGTATAVTNDSKLVVKEDIKASKEQAQKQNQLDTSSDTSGTKSTMTATKQNPLALTDIQKRMAATIAKFLKESGYALDLGKIFAALTLVVTDGDTGIFQDMKQRNYRALNAYVKEAAHSTPENNTQDTVKFLMRKFILACVGTGVINKPDDLGHSAELPSQRFVSDFNQRKILEAANKPSSWLLHSFLDMAQSDCRGRMLRAFPTFYMILVDEGREIGYWKLHDNFYNTNSISDIKITKSRKNPSDICTITMSNIFNTFTDQDEDGKYNYKYNYSDVFKSIFSPKAYAEDEEIRRKTTQEINKAKIRTGARIHVRLGYGNDASIMPLSFNGVVAEVQEGPVVQLVAQGDGIELCNQILDVDADTDIDKILYRSNFMGNTLFEDTGGQTPKTILDNLLTTTGSWLAKQVKDWSISKYFDENPYGLYHFGSRDFKDIIQTGEPTQNIYEVDKNPSFGYIAASAKVDTTTNINGNTKPTTDESGKLQGNISTNTTEYILQNDIYNPAQKYEEIFNSDNSTVEGPPTLSFKVANKTLWDIAHICASSNPEFITSIAPFNFRSTLFFGRPHYYYAYDYKQPNNMLVERRKPFQQYHVYFSATDIVNNQITTSTKKVKTVITGLFKRKTPFTENCKVGPLHADYSIYPENQRSIIFDTQYIGKYQDCTRGYPGRYGKDNAGTDGTFSALARTPLQKGLDIIKDAADNIGYTIGDLIPEGAMNDKHHKVAWNMSASKLKDCMKELYQGQLVIMGDPSVKPYDRIIFSDLYRDMNGQFLVRDVTQMFSAQTGFTTAVTPDCIVTVDDRDEYIVQSACSIILARSVQTFTTYMIAKGIGSYFATKGMESIQNAEKLIKDSQAALKKTALGKRSTELAKQGTEKVGGLAKKTLEKASSLKKIGKMKNIGSIAKTLVKGGLAVAGGVALAPEALIGTVIGLAASFIISTSLSSALYNWIRNLRVVKVFPLKRYGKPYVSGLDGSHGLIYGSPSWDKEDYLGKIIGTVFAPGKGDSMGSMVANIFRELFTSEDVMNEAAKFTHENDMVDADGNPTQTEEMFKGLENNIMRGTMCFEGASERLKLQPRAAVDDYTQVKKNTDKYRCSDVTNISKDPALNKLIVIKSFPSIEPFVRNRFLRIVHDAQVFSDISRIREYNLNVKGHVTTVYGITDNDGHIDFPILHQDACVVLSDILYKAYRIVTNGSVSNANDNAQTIKDTNGQFIVLKKAYTVGDNNLYSSSGFSFIIEPHGSPLTDQFPTVIQNIMDNANSEDDDGTKHTVFQYQCNGSEYACVVTPPNQ